MVGFGPADLGSNPSRATSKQAHSVRCVSNSENPFHLIDFLTAKTMG